MEIISKILIALGLVVLVVLAAGGIIFFSLLIDMRCYMKRRKALQQELTREELRLYELTSLVTKFSDVVTSHIEVIIEKRLALQNKKSHYTDSPANNTDIHK